MWYLLWFVAIAFIVYVGKWSALRLEARFAADPEMENKMANDFSRQATR